MTWGALITDTATGANVQLDARVGDLQMTNSLEDGGTLTCDLRVDDPYEALRTLRRVVWPTSNGQPADPYLITELPRTSVNARWRPVVAVRADVALLQRRRIRQTLDFTNVDQLDIYRDIIRYVTAIPTEFTPAPMAKGSIAAIPWLELDTTLSGKLRTRLATGTSSEEGYPGAARKIAWEILTNLRNLEDGFEHRLRPYMVPGVGPRCQIQLGYPRVGTAADRAAVGFEYPGGNIGDVAYGEDGSEFFTSVDYLGEEKNNTRPIGTATDDAAHAAGYPLLETAWSETSVSESGTLNAKAAGKLFRKIPAGWGITLDGTRQPTLQQYGLGDHAVLRVRAFRNAPMVERVARITGWTVTVQGRKETVVPVLTDAGARIPRNPGAVSNPTRRMVELIEDLRRQVDDLQARSVTRIRPGTVTAWTSPSATVNVTDPDGTALVLRMQPPGLSWTVTEACLIVDYPGGQYVTKTA